MIAAFEKGLTGVHNALVVPFSGPVDYQLQGLLQAVGRSVRAMGGQRLHHVCNADNAGFEQDFLSLEPMGVSRTV